MARWLSLLLPVVERVREESVSMTQLLVSDPLCFRIWAGKVSAIDQHFGKSMRRSITQLIAELAGRDAQSARHLASFLPEQLAKVAPGNRDLFLRLLRGVSKESSRFTTLLLGQLPTLIQELEEANELVVFINEALAIFAHSARQAEVFLRRESQQSQQSLRGLRQGVSFDEIVRQMVFYARAHCGENVQLRIGGERGFSDGRHIYLPARLELEPELGRLAYRVLTARNAGYIEFGTLDLDLAEVPGEWLARRDEEELELERCFRSFPNSTLARDLFMICENHRVEHAVRNEYPGVGHLMDRLASAWQNIPARRSDGEVEKLVFALREVSMGRSAEHDHSVLDTGEVCFAELRAEHASVADSVRAVQCLFPPLYALLTKSIPEMMRSRPSGTSTLSGGDSTENPGAEAYQSLAADEQQGQLDVSQMTTEDREQEARAQRLMAELAGSGEEVPLAELRKRSRFDFQEASEFLDRMPGPGGPLREDGRVLEAPEQMKNPQLAEDCDPLPDAFLYSEWDHSIDDYKPEWVQLREFIVHPRGGAYAEQIQLEHGAEIARVRRVFEALKPENLKRQRGLEAGDELDIDRVIHSRVSARMGETPDTRVYSKRLHNERDTAVAFLVDLSSSTNELANGAGKRILDVEREALVVISEAVDAIGDSFAVYGFSGFGRDQVAFYIAKDVDEPWDERARKRVGHLSWKMENRDGAAIRHCVQRMQSWSAKNKVLILLSDGKPLDCGCEEYSDSYAQADTRMALKEARRFGVQVFCITVDPYGQEYLASMYGPHSYIVIDNVESLPQKLPRVYRRLTM